MKNIINTKRTAFVLLGIFLALSEVSIHAQDVTRISVIESDSKLALFAVDASAAKSDDIASKAMEGLFRALLDQGVEGINGGQKLMTVDNQKWKTNFFKAKNPPYMAYVKGYQTEGKPVKNSVGEFKATVLVRVNVEFLMRQLKAYGVMK